MREIIKTVLVGLFYSVITLVVLNTLIFFIEITQSDYYIESWAFNFDSGAFNINNNLIGLEFGKIDSYIILGMLFVFSVFLSLKKQDYIRS